MIYELNF